MIGENYHLALYQAILDKNLTKMLWLRSLTNEEKLNYPKEYPNLNTDLVLQSNELIDVINSLLRTTEYKELYLQFDDAINPLATPENMAIRDKAALELLEYPLIDYCPTDRSSIIESLLAVSYSKVITKEEVITKLTPLISQSSIIADVLLTVTTSTTNSFSIALIDNEIENYDPTFNSSTGGFYNPITDKLVITNQNSELNLSCLIHELAHKTMTHLFLNGSNPYNNDYSRYKYHNAIKNTLLNIQAFIKQDFGLDIIFENTNDTWQMGKTLSTILFPQYLKDNGIQEFISLLGKYNLNIDTQFLWLSGYSPLGAALTHLNFELADALVAAGATLKSEILHASAMFDINEIMNWFLENKSMIEINYKDCKGMTALDYASDPQIVQTLISLGATAYPLNFEPICSIDLKCQHQEDDLTITEEQLYELRKLLSFYNQDYDQDEEDSEFIVRLPQIISSGLYKGKIIEIFEPLAEYWQEIISPAANQYQNEHSMAMYALHDDVCFA